MKLKVNRTALLAELNYVCKTVPSNPTLPALGCVLLGADTAGAFKLTATNLDTALTASGECAVAEAGEVCLPAKRMQKIVAEMVDVELNIETDDKHGIKITGGACGFKLLGLPGDDFPVAAVPKAALTEMPGSVLADALAPVIHAASTDETRFVLNGALLEMEKGEVRAVCTDGKRLAIGGGAVGPDAARAILPTEAVKLAVLLARAGDKISIGFSGTSCQLISGPRGMVSKLIEGSYPNWKQVLPASQKHKLEVTVEPVKTALHRVASIGTDTVTLTLAKKRLTISGSVPEVGSATEGLPMDAWTGPALTMGFAPGYLLDALANCGDTAFLNLEDELSALVVTSDRFVEVIMPKRTT